jgi:hypothetical protein
MVTDIAIFVDGVRLQMAQGQTSYDLELVAGKEVLLVADALPAESLVQILLWEVDGAAIEEVARVERARVALATGPDTALSLTAGDDDGLTAVMTVTALGSGGANLTRTIRVTTVPE